MRKFLATLCLAGLGIAGFLTTQSRAQQSEQQLRALVPKSVAAWGTPASHLGRRWTMVLEKRAKGWIVVHEHVSAPLGGS